MNFLCLLCLLATMPSGARADGLIAQIPDMSDPVTYVFPNWRLAQVGAINLEECPDSLCTGDTDCPIVALTLLNYGTADGVNDITGLYANLVCGKTDVWATMTYADVWLVDGKAHPAWTWSGVMPWAEDPENGCEALPILRVHANIGSCPTEGRTLIFGLGFDASAAVPGGLLDDCNYFVPPEDELRVGKEKFIRYVVKKVDRQYAAPADTLRYTIFYGAPGGPSISGFIITDTLPAYTHYLVGTASIPPDLLWDPKPGPPQQLRWTLPGVPTTVWGRTQELSFSVSVDWGNTEAFEPGSGDQAAPEGFRLDNRAAVEALGSGCEAARANPPIETVVRRYIIWKVADQDLLFAPRLGYPDDEIIYSIYLKNQSTKKTLWNIRAWDTVPPELTTWKAGLGFDDPFLGWTMTPTPSAVGAPGWLESEPGTTLLTWTFDLPPSGTLEIKWKASAGTPDCLPGETSITKISVMELGAPGTLNGTGHSKYPRCFVHVAPIALRTTYFSYVGYAAMDTNSQGMTINFYPLNMAATFELRKRVHWGDDLEFEGMGGVSESIVNYAGNCFGFIDGGYGGCGVERAPARYEWVGAAAEAPNAVLYKLTANAPLLWIMMPFSTGGDAFTYISSTSLNYAGFCHYSFRRSKGTETTPGIGESWVIINTSVDPEGNFNPDLATSAHIFKWDPVNMRWFYVKSADIDKNSIWVPFPGCTPTDQNHYKVISSDARLILYQGLGTLGEPFDSGTYNDNGGLVPNAENGLLTSLPGSPGTFYPVTNHDPSPANIVVGNNSLTAPATFNLYRYQPKNPDLATPGIPATLAGTSGSWLYMGQRTAGAGLTALKNPYIFGSYTGYDPLSTGVGSTANGWKVEWVSGGNLSVVTGKAIWREFGGGSPVGPVNGMPTGDEFWLHMSYGWGIVTWGILLFCPSEGVTVTAQDHVDGMPGGYNSTYTTTGPDQCIFFKALSDAEPGKGRLWQFKVQPDALGRTAEMMAMYHERRYTEKFFTAPFVATGVHYDVIAPAVVYAGQEFWITVAVILGEGETKIDYTGISTFTSTDPTASIMAAPMGLFDYSWALADEGVRVFALVTMDSVGFQSIVINDTWDGSITGLTTIRVVGVDIKFHKEPRSAVAASGDVVQFRICWSNFSTGSASEFVITDAVPRSMRYFREDPLYNFCDDGTYGRPVGTAAFSTTDSNPLSFSDIPPGGTSANVTWLRWTIPMIAAKTSGCACFKAVVD